MRLLLVRGAELGGVGLKELRQPLRVGARDVVEGERGDVIGLAGTHESVVFEEVMLFGVVRVGRGLEDTLGFGSGGEKE